jgi:hypothetical protein
MHAQIATSFRSFLAAFLAMTVGVVSSEVYEQIEKGETSFKVSPTFS